MLCNYDENYNFVLTGRGLSKVFCWNTLGYDPIWQSKLYTLYRYDGVGRCKGKTELIKVIRDNWLLLLISIALIGKRLVFYWPGQLSQWVIQLWLNNPVLYNNNPLIYFYTSLLCLFLKIKKSIIQRFLLC